MQNVTNLPYLPNVPTKSARKLKAVRCDFIEGISKANLHALLVELLSSRETVRDKIGRKYKACQSIDKFRYD